MHLYIHHAERKFKSRLDGEVYKSLTEINNKKKKKVRKKKRIY